MNHLFIANYHELKAYQTALDSAVQVFELSRDFPPEERSQLTAPMLQAARLVCVDVAQAWQRRRYHSAFVARLNHAEAEAVATQVWLEIAVLCSYLDAQAGQELHHDYQEVLGDLSRLIQHSAAWTTPDHLDLTNDAWIDV